MQLSNVDNAGDMAPVRLTEDAGALRDLLKRVFDVLVSLMLLVLSSPVMAVSDTLIRLTSPGSIIFAQSRVGRHGVPFTVYKFRTMLHGAEAKTGPVLASGLPDKRLAKVGRWLRAFRIDELPQLWNVLKGEMSLVGPRPERPELARNFEQIQPDYSRRHQVRPGITGLAQVCAGYHTDARDKLRFDLIYVSQQSLWLVFVILVRMVLVVLRPNRHM